MKVMNVAVVGAGIYGINHVNAYTWNPNTNLVAVCDLNKEITDRIAEQYNVKTYNDVNEMLDNEEIDAVSIATPDAFHMDPALAAIRHGKPILVEKPLATTSEDAKKILAEAEKYNVRVAVDYHKRWDPAAINVRNELQNEESGAPIRGYMCMATTQSGMLIKCFYSLSSCSSRALIYIMYSYFLSFSFLQNCSCEMHL